MPEITVKIPDGDYCEGCQFLNHYTHRLVNMFGDPTGNFREGYECKHYKCDLEVERADCGCYENVKKCGLCTMTEEQRIAYGLILFTILGKMNKEDSNA